MGGNKTSVETSVTEDYGELSERAAEIIADAVRNKPNLVLGLATGSTPLGCYRRLIRMHEEEGLDFRRVVTFNLDEYVGLPPTHPQSYRYPMNENLFNHINIRMENSHVPNGSVDDFQESCREFEELIRESGGIELQLLGIGLNGHIGFNEPGSPFDSRTRAVDISEQARKRNARFFNSAEEVPPRAITMGIETIMESRKIMLLASGKKKRDCR